MSADAADAATASDAPVTGEGAEGAELVETGEEGSTGQPDPAEDLRHWKELARKHERRAKENAAAAKKLSEIESANMSELEKAQAAQREAERERDEARDMHTRMLAAATHDLPPDLIEFLGSGTEDEINERAELLAAVIEETAQAIAEQLMKDKGIPLNGNGTQAQQPAARPVESLRAGSAPAGQAPSTQEQWFRQLLGQ